MSEEQKQDEWKMIDNTEADKINLALQIKKVLSTCETKETLQKDAQYFTGLIKKYFELNMTEFLHSKK